MNLLGTGEGAAEGERRLNDSRTADRRAAVCAELPKIWLRKFGFLDPRLQV
jgi:hypothetical protein